MSNLRSTVIPLAQKVALLIDVSICNYYKNYTYFPKLIQLCIHSFNTHLLLDRIILLNTNTSNTEFIYHGGDDSVINNGDKFETINKLLDDDYIVVSVPLNSGIANMCDSYDLNDFVFNNKSLITNYINICSFDNEIQKYIQNTDMSTKPLYGSTIMLIYPTSINKKIIYHASKLMFVQNDDLKLSIAVNNTQPYRNGYYIIDVDGGNTQIPTTDLVMYVKDVLELEQLIIYNPLSRIVKSLIGDITVGGYDIDNIYDNTTNPLALGFNSLVCLELDHWIYDRNYIFYPKMDYAEIKSIAKQDDNIINTNNFGKASEANFGKLFIRFTDNSHGVFIRPSKLKPNIPLMIHHIYNTESNNWKIYCEQIKAEYILWTIDGIINDMRNFDEYIYSVYNSLTIMESKYIIIMLFICHKYGGVVIIGDCSPINYNIFDSLQSKIGFGFKSNSDKIDYKFMASEARTNLLYDVIACVDKMLTIIYSNSECIVYPSHMFTDTKIFEYGYGKQYILFNADTNSDTVLSHSYGYNSEVDVNDRIVQATLIGASRYITFDSDNNPELYLIDDR